MAETVRKLSQLSHYVRVTRIVTDVNMRLTRSIWENEPKVLRGLAFNEVVLGINRSHTMVRLFDVDGVQHTIYAYAGEKFDLRRIEEMVTERTLCLGLSIPPRSERCAVRTDVEISLAPAKPRKVQQKKVRGA